MNRKTVIISSILGALLAMGSAQAELSYADRTLQRELQGIGAISPTVGPSTVVRTERVPGISVSYARAVQLGLATEERRVVARYEFANNPAQITVSDYQQRLIDIGAAAPVAGIHMVPETAGERKGIAATW